MHCPRCNHPKSKILRTRPEGDASSRGLTRQCKAPACGVIFTTYETVISVLDDSATSGDLRDLIARLSGMGGRELQQVKQTVMSL